TVVAKYEFIESHRHSGLVYWTIVNMCAWLEVSTSGYYDWRSRPISATAARRQALTARIWWYFDDSDQTYGYRRVHADLVAEGTPASPELVRQIMAEEGMVACQPRPFRVTTDPDADAAQSTPDLVQRDFTATAPGQKFVGDITYIHTWQGFLYLATVIDCYSKKVVGHAMADHMRAELVVQALDNAAATTIMQTPAIFHSDKGVQGGFTWLSQHLDETGGWRWLPRAGVRRPVTCPQRCVGSGVRIGHCVPRCVPQDVRPLRGRCSVSSGR